MFPVSRIRFFVGEVPKSISKLHGCLEPGNRFQNTPVVSAEIVPDKN